MAVMNERKVYFYKMHDCKMICNLTQNLLWGGKSHPYLLCSSQWGDRVLNPNYKCKFLSDEKQQHLFEKSVQKFAEKLNENSLYDKDIHHIHADKNLKGCTHFEFNPKELKRNSIWFETFHLSAVMTVKFADYLRQLILKKNTDVQCEFNNLILTFWSEFKVIWWCFNRTLVKTKGLELKVFIEYIPKIKSSYRVRFLAACREN